MWNPAWSKAMRCGRAASMIPRRFASVMRPTVPTTCKPSSAAILLARVSSRMATALSRSASAMTARSPACKRSVWSGGGMGDGTNATLVSSPSGILLPDLDRHDHTVEESSQERSKQTNAAQRNDRRRVDDGYARPAGQGAISRSTSSESQRSHELRARMRASSALNSVVGASETRSALTPRDPASARLAQN